MTTIVLTYRNRDINIVTKCLNSFKHQTNKNFRLVIVNYGSNEKYTTLINETEKQYPFLSIINCKTQGQLWCKSRAINIALRQCETTYFFVGDIDMMYHPEFIEKLNAFKKNETVTYFQVGFLSQEESKLNKDFIDYIINFKSTYEATGMTFFKTVDLKSVKGYDEFYNGWGSEDTDVHIRLKNAGFTVDFFDKEILILHQWHAKHYRTKDSLEPFHSYLEVINYEYLQLTEKSKNILPNTKFDYGLYKDSDYDLLRNPEQSFTLTNKAAQVKAFINSILLKQSNTTIKLSIKEDEECKSIKQLVKGIVGKKTIKFLDMETVNNTLLETIISNLRNSPYHYKYNPRSKTINLTIKL